MEINCISCGHNIVLDNTYSDYEGNVRCWICHQLLEIKVENGNVHMVRIAGQVGPSQPIGTSSDFNPHFTEKQEVQGNTPKTVG